VENYSDIGDEIGQGQYAVVHRGTHNETGQVVAIKIIDKGDTGMTVTDKEVAVMLRIDDPNCVKLYEVYETETEVQMVLELLEGADLFDRIINKQKYSEEEAKILMKRVCLGVEHLHSKNIMHRDLKPENILLSTPDDDVLCKVGDFGLSRLFPEGGPREQKTGTLCGTPGYVAPEVLNRVPYSYGVDIWSLGVIAYITLCGFPPFPLDMQAESVKKVKTADFSFPSPYWDGNSEECKDFIKKMIHVDPDKRATLAEVVAHPWLNS
jgi:calcium/calmodulin-dependent protein kinase I